MHIFYCTCAITFASISHNYANLYTVTSAQKTFKKQDINVYRHLWVIDLREDAGVKRQKNHGTMNKEELA